MHKIDIIGAKQNNLKNIDVSIKRGKITAITGVSGSGKSSLAFDTILVEAQRRYYYTLSTYVRQFLPWQARPNVSKITGLSPVIALSQYENAMSPRSTLASFTDLNELMGLLFSKFGKKVCPVHKVLAAKRTQNEILDHILKEYPNQTVAICSPLFENKKGAFQKELESYSKKGFTKIFCTTQIVNLVPIPKLDKNKKHTLKLIVDLITISTRNEKRLAQTLQTAFQTDLKTNKGLIEVFKTTAEGQLILDSKEVFSLNQGCPECGYSWPNMDLRHFSPNSLGKCDDCEGLGFTHDEDAPIKVSRWLENCDNCDGTGLNPALEHITFLNNSIHDFYKLPISKFFPLVEELKNKNSDSNLSKILSAMSNSLKSLVELNLNYLCLKRRLLTLSAGELQRVRLARVLSQPLKGVLYILDEPSQGLHPEEIDHLFEIIEKIQRAGNTILIVDHDLQLLKKVDEIIELGPFGGELGGHLISIFSPKSNLSKEKSLTGKFLRSEALIPKLVQKEHSEKNKKENIKVEPSFIHFLELAYHNVSIPKISFQKNGINVISGLSGAGKTTIMIDIVYQSLFLKKPVHCKKILGIESTDQAILIDRKPLGKNSLSFMATYLKIFDDIRALFANTTSAKILGYDKSNFSLRNEKAKCEECLGAGFTITEMKLVEDTKSLCNQCQGKRFNGEILTILFKGLNISETLNLTIHQAIEHFAIYPKISRKILLAQKIGLGYLSLGQTLSGLSGGEAQRLKLISLLHTSQMNHTYIFIDEPTRGLHEYDIQFLWNILLDLKEKNATMIIIEHHRAVIKSADWVLNIGPKSAENGGKLLYCGSPT